MPKYQIKVDGVEGTWGVEADDESQLDAAADEIRKTHAKAAPTPAPMAASHQSLSERIKTRRAAPLADEEDDLGQADPVIPEAPPPKPSRPSGPSAPIQRSRFDIPSGILDRLGEALGGSTDLPSEPVRPGKPLYAGKPVDAKPTTQPAQDILTPLDVATLGPLRRGLLQPAAKINEAIHEEATGPMIEQPIRRAAETAGNALRGLKIPAADRGMQPPEVGNELGRMPGDVVQGLGNALGAAASDPVMLAATAAGGGMPALGARALEGMGGYFGVKGAHELTANAIPEAVANYGTASPEEKSQIVQNLVEQGALTASMVPGILHSALGDHGPLPKIASGNDAAGYDINMGNMWPRTAEEAAPMPSLRPWQGGPPEAAPGPGRPAPVDTQAGTATLWGPPAPDAIWGGRPSVTPSAIDGARRGQRYVRQDDGSFLPGVKPPAPMEQGGSNRGMAYDMNNGPGAPWDIASDPLQRLPGAAANTPGTGPSMAQRDPNVGHGGLPDVPWNPRSDPFDRLTADALGNKISKWQQAITPDASGRVPEDPVGDLLTLVKSEQNSGPGAPGRGMFPPSSYNTPPKPSPDFEPAPWADLLGDFLKNPPVGGQRFAEQLQQAQGKGGYGPIIDALESILPPRPPAPPDPRRGLRLAPTTPDVLGGVLPERGPAPSGPTGAEGDSGVPGAVVEAERASATPLGLAARRRVAEVPAEAAPSETPLVPERPETIEAQMDRLRQKVSAAVFIPKGQPVPRTKGFGRTDVSGGDAPGTWVFDKDVYRPTQIATLARDDAGRAILLGKPPKPTAGEPEAVISTKQPDGTPVTDTVVSPETAPEVIKQQVAQAAPGEQVVAETPQETLAAREDGLPPDERTDAELKRKLSEVQEKIMSSMGSSNLGTIKRPKEERAAELVLLREQDKAIRAELGRRKAAVTATPPEPPPAAPASGLAERAKKKETEATVSPEPQPPAAPWEEPPAAPASITPSQPPPSEAVESQPTPEKSAVAPEVPSAPAPEPAGDMTKAEGGGATMPESVGPHGLKMEEIAKAAARLNIPLPSRESMRESQDATIERAKRDFEKIGRALAPKTGKPGGPEPNWETPVTDPNHLSKEEAYVGLSQFRDITDNHLPRLTEELEKATQEANWDVVTEKQKQIDGNMINAAALAERLYKGGSEAGRRLALQKIMAPDGDMLDPLYAIRKGQALTKGRLSKETQDWIIEKAVSANKTKAGIQARVQKNAAEAMERLQKATPEYWQKVADFGRCK